MNEASAIASEEEGSCFEKERSGAVTTERNQPGIGSQHSSCESTTTCTPPSSFDTVASRAGEAPQAAPSSKSEQKAPQGGGVPPLIGTERESLSSTFANEEADDRPSCFAAGAGIGAEKTAAITTNLLPPATAKPDNALPATGTITQRAAVPPRLSGSACRACVGRPAPAPAVAAKAAEKPRSQQAPQLAPPKAGAAPAAKVAVAAAPLQQAKATVAFAADSSTEGAAIEPNAAKRRAQQLQHQQRQQLQQQQFQLQQRQRQREAAARKEAQCAFPVPAQAARKAAGGARGEMQVQMSNGGSKGAAAVAEPPPHQPTAAGGGAAGPLAYRHMPTHVAAKQGRGARSSTSSPARAMAAAPGKGRPSGSDADGVVAAAAGGGAAAPPTLLFERLVSEEVQELKAYARIIEDQNRRIAELERVHEDLEARLERRTNEQAELEATLETREQDWTAKCDALEAERDRWKKTVEDERVKNERLLGLVYRKDKEIHRMIQRKYDSAKTPHQQHGHSHLHGHSHRSDHSLKRGNNDKSKGGSPGHPTERHGSERSFVPDRHKSPHEMLLERGNVEAVRERNVTNSLLDFFGM